MAEFTNPHRQQRPPSTPRPVSSTVGPHGDEPVQQEEEFYNRTSTFAFDFDPFSHLDSSSNPFFFADYGTSFDLGFDLNAEPENPGCEYEDSSCFCFGGEEDDEEMNFVTDLFEPRQSLVTEDLTWDMDSVWEELDHGFRFGPTLSTGLRVAGIDSESDSEVNLGFINNDDDNHDNFGIINYLTNENERDELEWEEVSERIQFDERDNLNLVINGIEEVSVSSAISLDELAEEQGNLEWEVLLAVNNSESTFEFEYAGVNNIIRNEVLGFSHEDYVLTMEDDALFGQLVENEHQSKGSPPAAKSVVENLTSVVLTKEEIGENNSNNCVACAVCKNEFAVGENATKLPCRHLYHGGCIIPWLEIRNTCPLCRYELPTDDADYEKKRSERVGDSNTPGLINDFERNRLRHGYYYYNMGGTSVNVNIIDQLVELKSLRQSA
ncbi:hypothetical protein OROGR_006922 [Orobanche gracilis]